MNEFGIFLQDPWEFDTLYNKMPQLCMKGGGGGSSGKVNYPTYMKEMHEDWLNDLDTLITGTTSPFTDAVTWDPDLTLASMEESVAAFSTAVAGVSSLDDWQAAISTAKAKWDAILSDDVLDENVRAFGELLEEDIVDNTLPQFQSGMRDINAVMTSAFVMGEAKIWSGKTKEVSKYSTGLRLQADQAKTQAISDSSKVILDVDRNKLSMEHALAQLAVENYRMKIVAKTEECQRQFELDEKDALWPFELYQYGANMLAGIGGGTVGSRGPSKTASALGGALSGAAAGAMVGGPVGAAVGGAIGLAASLF